MGHDLFASIPECSPYKQTERKPRCTLTSLMTLHDLVKCLFNAHLSEHQLTFPVLQMAFEPPSPSLNKEATRTPRRGRETQPPHSIPPSRAIADAWLKETKENQEKWREADAKLKDLFNQPNRQLGRRAKM